MKKFLFLFGLLFSITVLYAQEELNGIKEMPKNIKRYDFKQVDRFQYDTYTVLVITDCITNEKKYKLKISYHDDRYEDDRESYFSDGVVAELLKTFHYLITHQFEPEQKGEKSFIVGEVGEGLYYKLKPDTRRLELYINWDHLLVRIYDENTIKEFASLLFKIEKTFAEKGRDLKDAVISDDNKKEPLLFQL